MTRSNQLDFATRCIHAGQAPDPTTGAVMMPIAEALTRMAAAAKKFDAKSVSNSDIAWVAVGASASE